MIHVHAEDVNSLYSKPGRNTWYLFFTKRNSVIKTKKCSLILDSSAGCRTSLKNWGSHQQWTLWKCGLRWFDWHWTAIWKQSQRQILTQKSSCVSHSTQTYKPLTTTTTSYFAVMNLLYISVVYKDNFPGIFEESRT